MSKTDNEQSDSENESQTGTSSSRNNDSSPNTQRSITNNETYSPPAPRLQGELRSQIAQKIHIEFKRKIDNA